MRTVKATCRQCSFTRNTREEAALHARQTGHPVRVETVEVIQHGRRVPEVIAALDALEVPDSTGGDLAREALRSAGYRFGNRWISDAVRERKGRIHSSS